MLKKRIIPCLDIHDGRTVKGINFVQIRDAGDPVELAKIYVDEGADELVFLDITATHEKRDTLVSLVDEIAKEVNIPFTVGGGVRSVQDASALLAAGAEKITVNSSAVKSPDLLNKLAYEFGNQCIVLAVDTNFIDREWRVYVHGGRRQTMLNTYQWVQEAEDRGAGEILLTSMVHDGTKKGFAISLLQEVCERINIPVIASGGAGGKEDFREVFQSTDATGALAASVFHFGELKIPDLKSYLRNENIAIR